MDPNIFQSTSSHTKIVLVSIWTYFMLQIRSKTQKMVLPLQTVCVEDERKKKEAFFVLRFASCQENSKWTVILSFFSGIQNILPNQHKCLHQPAKSTSGHGHLKWSDPEMPSRPKGVSKATESAYPNQCINVLFSYNHCCASTRNMPGKIRINCFYSQGFLQYF